LVRFQAIARDHIMGFAFGHGRAWWSTLLVIVLVVFFLFIATGPGGVHSARAADDDASSDKVGEEPNLLDHIISSAGIVFGPLLLIVSIALVTLIVLLAMDLRMSVSIPPDFVEDFTDTVNKRQFKQAFDMARNETSFLGRVLTAGMGRLQYGIEDARDAAVNMTDSVKAGKETLLSYLASIGTLGPMIGLVGTVYGMIKSFMVLAVPGKEAKPHELADGISHALVVTLLGIGLSVPAIFFHNFFRNRLTRIAFDSNSLADDLLTQMYHNSRRPAVAEAVPAARPATATPVDVRTASAVKPVQ
jgi:biopolymer transport protein ExbB